jgi:hypothetical protein
MSTWWIVWSAAGYLVVGQVAARWAYSRLRAQDMAKLRPHRAEWAVEHEYRTKTQYRKDNITAAWVVLFLWPLGVVAAVLINVVALVTKSIEKP